MVEGERTHEVEKEGVGPFTKQYGAQCHYITSERFRFFD